MSDDLADDLLSIDVGADAYAEAAAGDTPSVPRTYQSEADFQQQKAEYEARFDGEDNYLRLLKVLPGLGPETQAGDDADTKSRSNLSKREFQLVGYAAGELYYDRKYVELSQLCQRLQERYVLDDKMTESVSRWMERSNRKPIG